MNLWEVLLSFTFIYFHDAEVSLIIANGFSSTTITGATNVLIDDRATFNFIENKHQRIPMWAVFGNFTINERANVSIINTYTSTPSDNYNIHFKSSNQKFIINNPESVVFYSKNANSFYTNNSLSYSFSFNRLNMWINSISIESAGDINNLPDYSWYKDSDLINISGNFTATATSVDSHNLTDDEVSSLPYLSNFVFQGRKQFSIGSVPINIHPINSTSTTISGHALSDSSVLIKYGDVLDIVEIDSDGVFKYTLNGTISYNTQIEITSCVSNSYIYKYGYYHSIWWKTYNS